MDNIVIFNTLAALATAAMAYAAWRAYWSYRYFLEALPARERSAKLAKQVLAAPDASDTAKELAGLLLAFLCSRKAMQALVRFAKTAQDKPLDRKIPDAGKYEETLLEALNSFSLAALFEDRTMAPKLYRLMQKLKQQASTQKAAACAQKKIKEFRQRESVVVKNLLVSSMKVSSNHHDAHAVPA